jgi:hypothetical protein
MATHSVSLRSRILRRMVCVASLWRQTRGRVPWPSSTKYPHLHSSIWVKLRLQVHNTHYTSIQLLN